MDKTAQTELRRTFLIEKLPEPLTPASSHIQLFDNYIPGTRLRLRRIRDPYIHAWTYILQQRFAISEDARSVSKVSEIYLSETEYAVFERLEGHEIRKNRYFHEFDRLAFAFDAYLGRLWGLHTAMVEFASVKERDEFEPPPFLIYEITADAFFDGHNLVDKTFEEIRQEVARLSPIRRDQFEAAAE